MTGTLARPSVFARTVATNPSFMVALLVLSDAAALITSVLLGVFLKVLFEGQAGLNGYSRLWPFLLVFIAFYSAVGLYSGAALSPPEELRRATFSSAFLFPTIAILTLSWRGSSPFLHAGPVCRSCREHCSCPTFTRLGETESGEPILVGISDCCFQFGAERTVDR